MREFITALRLFLVLTVLTGVIYPLVVSGIAQGLFADQANGSLIQVGGKVVGSRLIGQTFDDPKYFWGRPSSTAPGYNAGASSGSNLGPTNPALIKAIEDRVGAVKAVDPGNQAKVPTDLVTRSGSGLDPHISVAGAEYQIGRVARLRGLSEEQVREKVKNHTKLPFAGLLGEPVVNVLELNLDLDQRGPRS